MMKKVCVLMFSALLLSVVGCKDREKPTVTPSPSQGVELGKGEMKIDTLQVDTTRLLEQPDTLAGTEQQVARAHQEGQKQQTPKSKTAKKGQKQLVKGQTPDENVFDMRGPVSSATYTQGVLLTYNECIPIREANQRMVFNAKGQLRSSADLRITRNERGQITQIYRASDQTRNTFEWRNGRVYRVVVSTGRKQDWNECILKYNDRGEVISYLTRVYSRRNAKTPDDTFRTTITVLKRDSYGNWVSRRFRNPYETRVEKRIIQYHK